MRRIWKNIDGFDGYQISNKGEVRSYINNRYGPGNKKPHILKPCKNRHGYDTVQLGRGCRKLVHRLVAEAFIPNPHNLPIVRHKDDNPSNNNVSNLLWGTQVDNMQDCVRHGRLVGNIWPAIEANKKKVIAINVKTGEELEFQSQSEAARELNLLTGSISKVLLSQMYKTGDWTFRRLDKREADPH